MGNKHLALLWLLVGGFLLLGAPFAYTQPSNLLVNPGFEDGDLTGWSKYGGSVTVVSASRPVHSGTFAAQQQDSSSNSKKWLKQTVAVNGGNVYDFSAWVLIPDTTQADAFLRVAWYSSSDCNGIKFLNS